MKEGDIRSDLYSIIEKKGGESTFGVSCAATASKKEVSLPFLEKVTQPLDLRPENSATSSFYKTMKVDKIKSLETTIISQELT